MFQMDIFSRKMTIHVSATEGPDPKLRLSYIWSAQAVCMPFLQTARFFEPKIY